MLRDREQKFEYGSPETREVIDEAYQTCLDEALQWMSSDVRDSSAESGDASIFPQGKVAIFDASNHTRDRREWLKQELGDCARLLWVESLITDSDLEKKFAEEVVDAGPDYVGMSRQQREDAASLRRR